MTTDRWRRLDQVFAEAQEQDPQARAAFVARRCATDDALRDEVLALLDADSHSSGFLASTALDTLASEMAADSGSLRPGERVGAYVVERRLGSGGSGDVWRAHDARLGRDVAIKVLHRHVSADDDRLRRFVDEARTAGALNHPNLLTVYDVGEHEGAPFLVTECLEGTSLRTRLDAGPLALDEALTVAIGAARGLMAAHARGIVHRDLKPDNVFLRSDRGVKILDFGLAKLVSPVAPPQPGAPRTGAGVIVGTAGYMAPEQVCGGDVDARSDLFGLGATLYEMLGGERPFRGATPQAAIQASVATEPRELTSLNPEVPAALAAIVTRLLSKSPDERFHSAADLVWALEQVRLAPTLDDRRPPHWAGPRSSTRSGWRRAAWLPVLGVPLALGVWWWSQTSARGPDVVPLTQFTWALPAGVALGSAPVVSPDGLRIAFVGTDGSGSRLFVRDLASLSARAVPGTDDAKHPFWSPDSASIGFFARRRLMKVALDGGAPVALADAPDGRGGAWSTSGTIVFGPDLTAASLSKVPAGGGPVEPATLLDEANEENSHRWPAFLPDGIHFLFFVRSAAETRRGVYVGRIDQPAARPVRLLFQSESEVAYVPPNSGAGPGTLLRVQDGRLEALPFDAGRIALVGDGRTLPVQAGGPTPHYPSMVSASASVLVSSPSRMPLGTRLMSVDRNGGRLSVAPEDEPLSWPRLSPDGQRLAMTRLDPVVGNADIWVEDLARGTRVRVTTGPEADTYPVWSPDGTRLAYVSSSVQGSTRGTLTVTAADGTGVSARLRCPTAYCQPTDWSPDGRSLVVNRVDHSGIDIWVVPTTAGGAGRPLVAGTYVERDARLSPDGRFFAYVSNESGRPEVSVQSTSGPRTRIIVSAGGGDQPVWRRNGAELFFVGAGGRLRVATVHERRDGSLTTETPLDLDAPPVGRGHWGTQYDVSPDGGRIHLLQEAHTRPSPEFGIVMGWRGWLQ
jgi:serine/threonine protein kinase/Tol biopolymer transport system component